MYHKGSEECIHGKPLQSRHGDYIRSPCQKLAKILERVTDDQEVVIVRRKGAPPVALISASELEGLMETEHLTRSPKNEERLLSALRSLDAGKIKPRSIRDVHRELGLEDKHR